MMSKFLLCLLLWCVMGPVKGQVAVYFSSGDGLKISADLYVRNYSLPFIILCHQDGSNRSEYKDIAPRLLNLNYNCLAIDLRSGGKPGFADNETARRAQSENRTMQPLDALPDLIAAIGYVKTFNDRPVILFGSSFSASLCLLAAADNPRVQAVVAFSPGEYFLPRVHMAERISRFDKPLFICATHTELPYIGKMTGGIAAPLITLFKPEKDENIRGTGILTSAGKNRDECWFALMMFFKKLL